MKNFYNLLFQVIVCFYAIPYCVAGDSAYVAWSVPEGSDINIFYSVLSDARWSSPVQITQGGTNVTPAITVDGDGIVWIVWVDFVDESRFLKYARIRGNDIVQGRVSELPAERSYSPSIIVDRSNKPWIAWASYSGMDEDIFFSTWDGESWEAPKQVNPDNNVPDVTPTIGLGLNGRSWISWLSFNGEGYDTYTVNWSNMRWSSVKKIKEENNIKQKIRNLKARIPQFPAQAKKRLMGAVFISNKEEIQSISDQQITLPALESK